MRVKRSGQAAKIRRRRWGVVALVLAGLALCLLAALPVQAARNTQKHCFPLDTTAWRVSDAYGARTDPFTGKSAFHRGLDLACAAGTAVQAVQGGVVTAAAYSPSYGNHLRILHPDGCETRYAHLQYLYVRPGEVVQAGQTLGTVGQTGRATGAHLHLELWQQGAACDPAALLENAPGTGCGWGSLYSGTRCCCAVWCTCCSTLMPVAFCGWDCWRLFCTSWGTSLSTASSKGVCQSSR